MHDLAAAEAQYHFRCYDNFRKIPSSDSEQGLAVDDRAMKELVDEIIFIAGYVLGCPLSCMKNM